MGTKTLSIVTLKDDMGLWLMGEPLIQHITHAFSRLFQAMSPHLYPSSRTMAQCCPNSLFFKHAQSLTCIPQPDEIYRTLRDFPPLKALGPDGYHALFFQSNWPNLGLSIIQVIQEVFEQLTISPPQGIINLVLIPKVAHPELITQFCPISLCNTLYKLLSQLIVQRLKPYIVEVINPCQAGFMPGRRTSDNIIIVQEVIRTLKSRWGRDGYVAPKLDLEKAYGQLDQVFLKETLEFFQMPPSLLTLIMNMLSSTRFHILWNGAPLLEVVPSRGFRQGDPLLSYLFILYLEWLSIRLEEAVCDKVIHPINFRDRVHLSHLFFTDDIFLFTKAKPRNLRNILQTFCDSSGQLISVPKSKLWFSHSTPRHVKEQVAGIFGIPTVDHIGTYLGTPIFTTRRTAQSYQYLVDKIRLRIEGWQTKYLSMVGRATFIKASVASIPLYAIQTTLLPQKISQQIDKMSCHFLQGDTEHHHGCHTVSWDTVTLPKEAGGLGIPSTRHRNYAILMNQAWHLYTNPNTLWAQVLKLNTFPKQPCS